MVHTNKSQQRKSSSSTPPLISRMICHIYRPMTRQCIGRQAVHSNSLTPSTFRFNLQKRKKKKKCGCRRCSSSSSRIPTIPSVLLDATAKRALVPWIPNVVAARSRTSKGFLISLLLCTYVRTLTLCKRPNPKERPSLMLLLLLLVNL